MEIVLLCAGIGSRLNRPDPKCLTPLGDRGETILSLQMRALRPFSDKIRIVAGFQKEKIMKAFPDADYVVNERYQSTNTSKSLLLALEGTKSDVLWINGDVFFDPGVLTSVVGSAVSCMAVNRAKCGAEEVKYAVDSSGLIVAVSKELDRADGEAVGINFVKKSDIPLLVECLRNCADSDYFEKGIEMAVQKGMKMKAADIGDKVCIEIDFMEDLEKARELFKRAHVESGDIQ